MLPLLAPPVPRPAQGVRGGGGRHRPGHRGAGAHRRHLLVYDAGPQYSTESDAGVRVLLPLLRARGERRMDLLMLSHRDSDHVGGAAALLAGCRCGAVHLAGRRPPAAGAVSIHVALNHVTHYRYDRRSTLSPQVVRLRPAPHSRTRILPIRCASSRPSTSSTGSRTRSPTTWRAWSSRRSHRELVIEVDLVAEMSVINPFDFFLEPEAEKIPFAYDDEQAHELAPYLAKARCARRARNSRRLPRQHPARRRAHHRLPGGAQPAPAAATSAT
jgi:hypothetical protein